MAERPSVKDILARVRAGGPAPPSDQPAEQSVDAVDAPISETVEATPPPAAPAAPRVAAPSPSDLGRPLTLKEKLAAARNRPSVDEPTPVVSTAAATPAVEAVESASETVSKAPPASAAPELTPAALGRPLTLKEKLAAARGGGAVSAPSGSAAAKPASKPAGAAAPAAKAASTRTLPPIGQTSDPRDLAEHLRRTAADKDKQTKAAAAAKAPAAKAAAPKKVESKVVPPRPGKAAESVPASASLSDASRRLFFKAGFWIAAGWVTFTGGLAALSAMSLRFMFPNVLAEPPSTIKVGFPADFERDQVNERWKGEWGFWVVRSDVLDGEDKIYALSTICTHLGCPPNWLASEQKFKCPCHGSGFYITGVNFEGPAPRPLERYKVSMGDDGQIIVDKSMKFQEELGQWKDPESYIKA